MFIFRTCHCTEDSKLLWRLASAFIKAWHLFQDFLAVQEIWRGSVSIKSFTAHLQKTLSFYKGGSCFPLPFRKEMVTFAKVAGWGPLSADPRQQQNEICQWCRCRWSQGMIWSPGLFDLHLLTKRLVNASSDVKLNWNYWFSSNRQEKPIPWRDITFAIQSRTGYSSSKANCPRRANPWEWFYLSVPSMCGVNNSFLS